MIRPIARLAVFALAASTLTGCEKSTEPSPPAVAPAASTDASEAEHSHGEGPNGGTIADWGGGEYHLEFTVDHAAQEATVYVLDDSAKNPAPVAAEVLLLSMAEPAFQVELTPAPLEGEAAGTSSRFVGKHENLGVVQEFAGTISGEVDGTPYAGDFAEVAHGHDD